MTDLVIVFCDGPHLEVLGLVLGSQEIYWFSGVDKQLKTSEFPDDLNK
jgi:hypothetical protein